MFSQQVVTKRFGRLEDANKMTQFSTVTVRAEYGEAFAASSANQTLAPFI